MLFLVEFGINGHSQIFQKIQNALALRACAIRSAFKNLLVLSNSKSHSNLQIEFKGFCFGEAFWND